MYRAEVIEHSVSERGIMLASIEIEYPRQVLAEVVTHRKVYDTDEGYTEIAWSERTMGRDMSKNSASSRAIPFAKMLKKVLQDPYIPDKFSVAGPGMQAAGYMEGMEHEEAVAKWLLARDMAVGRALTLLTKDDREDIETKLGDQPLMDAVARCLNYAGVAPSNPGLPRSLHKQEINRLIEPWAWMTQIVTADGYGWANHFALRCHKDAAPAYQKIARMAYLALRKSSAKVLREGEWHLPYTRPGEKVGFVWHPHRREDIAFPDPVVMSVARCAWLSCMNQGKEASMDDARRTFDRLLGATPKHASPIEHQATPLNEFQEATWKWARSNLAGWLQARKLIVGEATFPCIFSDEEIASWGLVEHV